MIPPDLALIAWIPLVLMVFLLLPPRTAALITVMLGWLFLPLWQFSIPGFIDYTKSNAIALAGVIGVVFFDYHRLSRMRMRLWDAPIIFFCVLPGLTMAYLGYSAYASASRIIYGLLGFAVPYLLGKMYFSDDGGLRVLAIGMLIGTLLYVPLCLYEIRMSPQLNKIVYGFRPGSFGQVIRYGGYRPQVFMNHGLMVGLWMATGSLIALHLWRSGTVKRVMGAPMAALFAITLLTAIFVKSSGALVLLLIALVAYLEFQFRGRRWAYTLMIWIPLVYVGVRVTGVWSGQGLLEWIGVQAPERAESLAFRMESEDALIRSTSSYFWTGRGASGFNRAVSESGKEIEIVTDSLWIIVFASSGILTLSCLFISFLRPLIVVWRRLSRAALRDGNLHCAFVLALVLAMFFLDSLVNDMMNPVYLLVMGGLTGWGER